MRRMSTVGDKIDGRLLDAIFIGMVRGSVGLEGIQTPEYIAQTVKNCVTAHRELSKEVAHA
jgi:hypothetical protein